MARVKGEIKSVLLAPNQQPEWGDLFNLHRYWYASTKFDGNRCLVMQGKCYTRSMKPFPNRNMVRLLGDMLELSRRRSFVFDMELYDPELPHHAAHTSVFNSHANPIPDTMCVHVFDAMSQGAWENACHGLPFRKRIVIYSDLVSELREKNGNGHYRAVKQTEIDSVEKLKRLYERRLEKGFEGLMLRNPDGVYKHGRATKKQAIIYKMKPFETHDVLVVDVLQRRRMKEGLERKRDVRGYMEKVHTKDSYELDDNVGAVRVRFRDGTESEVNFGKGWPLQRRQEEVWRPFQKCRAYIVGKVVEIKHMTVGAKDGVRIGQLIRFRPDKTAREID